MDCIYCTYLNPPSAQICQMCFKSLNPLNAQISRFVNVQTDAQTYKEVKGIQCDRCTFINASNASGCCICDSEFDVQVSLVANDNDTENNEQVEIADNIKQMNSPGQSLYHYTSTAGANGIRKDGVIRSHNGVMLSTLKPEDHTRDDILRSINGNSYPSQFKNRADNVVYIDYSSLDSSKLNPMKPNLYKYSGDIKITISNVRDKPACTKQNVSSGGSSSSGSQSSQTFYFYTSTNTAAQIKSSRNIPGTGVILLTTMKPENCTRDEILNAIYGAGFDRFKYATSADWCVKIDGTKLIANKLKKRHNEVYEYSDSIAVSTSDVMDKPKCTKAGSGTQDDYLYHYTNTRGAQAIKAAGFLKKSGSSGAFGNGVYMTNLRPNDFFRDDILKNNYGGIQIAFKGRADWVVRVKKSALVPTKLKQVGSNITRDGSRQIFVYDDIIYVNSSDVFDKPKCHRAK